MKTTLHERFEAFRVQLKRSVNWKIRCFTGVTQLVTELTFTEQEAKRHLESLQNGRRHLVFVVLKEKGGAL